MIPLRDTIRSASYPVVNTALIALNVFVYLLELGQGSDLGRFIYIYGLVPARYSMPGIAAYFPLSHQIFSLFSFMFLHAGFWHLLGNMWFLYIFGDNVEDRLGSARYLIFYLMCGLSSGLAQLALNWHANVPTIGASGAIAGVMGAYFMLYPNARILTLVPVFFIPLFFEIPAYFFLGFWFLIQLVSAASRHGNQVAGIAWWAHIGGFAFGMLFLKVFTWLPSMGISPKVRRMTAKKTSHRLQLVRPGGPLDDPNLYGTITITPFEALTGTQKVVSIPGGLQKRLVRVKVPPGTKDGTLLRLRGVGKHMPDGRRGDLMLKVDVRF